MSALVINQAELRALLEAPNGPVVQDLMRRGQRVLNLARRKAPVDTGRLRASLQMVLLRDGQGQFVRIGSNLDYALFVHEGTGIYGPKGVPIRPRTAQFLRWPAVNNSGAGRRRYAGGVTERYIYARQVRGMRPRPFLLEALREGLGT